nr:hypothetical protein [Vibrio parahaemolyticus]
MRKVGFCGIHPLTRRYMHTHFKTESCCLSPYCLPETNP